MPITPYPAWPTSGPGAPWHAFFYPLCQLSALEGVPPTYPVIVPSCNGLWYEPAYATAEASDQFTVFHLADGTLTFGGDSRLFQGHAVVAELRARLEADWRANHAEYLAATSPAHVLAVHLPVLAGLPVGFDVPYYVETFRSFEYVRAQYQRTGQFRSLNAWLRGWHEEPSPFFLPASHADFRSADAELRANHATLAPTLDLARLVPVGLAPASPYFPDGNASLVYVDAQAKQLVCVNHYS